MKQDWQEVLIRYLVDTIETRDPRKTPSQSFTYIDVSSVSRSSFIVSETSEVNGEDAPSRARRVVRTGDIIFATIRPTLKRVACISDELNGAVCSTGFFVLRPRKSVLSKYLFYWLLGEQFSGSMEKLQRGASYPAVSDNDVKNQLVALPTVSEQKRIVAILDEAFAGIDAAIANTEKNLANARELFESFLASLFYQKGKQWGVKPVGEFAEHSLGKMLDKNKNKGLLKPYLRNINVQWFRVDTKDLLEMKIEQREEARFQVKRGDLLICEGGYPGRAAIWDQDEPIFFQKALHRVRCYQEIYNYWLLYYLYFLDARDELKGHFTGAGIQHFTGRALKSFKVPYPSVSEVSELIPRIEELHQQVLGLEKIYMEKLSALAELKQSLLQKAFSGELTANVAKKEVDEAVA